MLRPLMNLADSFSCPHCGALAHQQWFKGFAYGYDKGQFPLDPDMVRDDIEEFIDRNDAYEGDRKDIWKQFFKELDTREPFFSQIRDEAHCGRISNVDFSRCYSCKRFAIWLASKIIYLLFSHDVVPNSDLPGDIKLDFIEAQKIVVASPRGASALLRLCVQKLCKHLGEKGKNINDDIGELVSKGLDIRIQQALDVVRVIGNEAVHPGQIDMRDNLEVANKLFTLVNFIADALITQPKLISTLYGTISQSKLDEIAKRDKPKP